MNGLIELNREGFPSKVIINQDLIESIAQMKEYVAVNFKQEVCIAGDTYKWLRVRDSFETVKKLLQSHTATNGAR